MRPNRRESAARACAQAAAGPPAPAQVRAAAAGVASALGPRRCSALPARRGREASRPPDFSALYGQGGWGARDWPGVPGPSPQRVNKHGRVTRATQTASPRLKSSFLPVPFRKLLPAPLGALPSPSLKQEVGVAG
ncbi:hypothetical protein VULLAG_LOCUS12715 [Vulpes lagopus]